MEVIRLILSLVVMTVIGYSVFRILVRERENSYFLLEKAALSFALGMCAVTFSLLVLALAGMSFNLINVLLPWGIILVISIFTVRGQGDPSGKVFLNSENDRAGKRLFAALGAILALQAASIFLRALSKTLESYDAILNFGIKSKMFFMYNGFPLKLSALEGVGAGHLDYPLLVPLCQTWVYKFLGEHNDNLVMVLFPLIYVSFGIFFYYSLARMFGRKQAFLFTFLLCTVPQIATFAANGYGDVALTFMVTAAFIFLIRYFREERRDLLALSAVFSGMGFLTKNEGISFILATFFVMAFLVLRGKDKKRHVTDIALFYLLPLAITAAPWILVKHVLGVTNSDIELSKLTAAQFQENVRHIPFILNKFQQEIFGPKKWNILWMAVLGFTALRFRKTKEPYVGIIGVFILLNLFIYFSSFMVLTGKNIYFHVNTTISRLMMHFSGLSLFFVAFLIKEDMEDALNRRGKQESLRSSVFGRQNPKIQTTDDGRQTTKAAFTKDRFVFLDRDGVINKDPAGWTPHSYVTTPRDFIFLPRVFEAMKLFKNAGYEVVIISNQQGVGKGFFARKDLEAVNAEMVKKIKRNGGKVSAAYYCTHLTEENCGCKKPKPGMFLKAQEELGIKELAGKYFVGDTERDIQAGKGVGLKTILVLSGKSTRQDAESWQYKPDHICVDLEEAARVVIEGGK